MGFFEKLEKNRIAKKREIIKKTVQDEVRKKIESWDKEKLAYFQQKYDSKMKEPFERKKRIGTLTEQYENFKAEYEDFKSKGGPYPYAMAFSVDFNTNSSGVGFLYFAEDVLIEYGIAYQNYDDLEDIAYEFVKVYEERKRELDYTGPNDLIRLERGIKGEKRLFGQLDVWSNSEEFFLLSNAVLEYEGKSFETDALLFTRYGLFSLEIKNIGEEKDYKIKITQDGQWLKIIKEQEESLSNITSQVNYHISMTEKMIKGYEKENNEQLNMPVNSIIIIANEDVRIENESNMNILRVDSFINDIRNLEPLYSLDEMEKLKNWMEKYTREEKGYEYEDLYQEFLFREKEIRESKERFHLLNKELNEVFDEICKQNRFYNDFTRMAKDSGRWG